jgi:hypothetical protein
MDGSILSIIANLEEIVVAENLGGMMTIERSGPLMAEMPGTAVSDAHWKAMIASLQDVEIKGSRILQENTLAGAAGVIDADVEAVLQKSVTAQEVDEDLQAWSLFPHVISDDLDRAFTEGYWNLKAHRPAVAENPFLGTDKYIWTDLEQAEIMRGRRGRIAGLVGSTALVLAGMGMLLKTGLDVAPAPMMESAEPVSIGSIVTQETAATPQTTISLYELAAAAAAQPKIEFAVTAASGDTLHVTAAPAEQDEVAVVEEAAEPEPDMTAQCASYYDEVSEYPWDVPTAMAVMEAESGCDPTELNPENHYDRYGNVYCVGSAGLFQLSCHDGLIYNAKQNIAKAYEKFKTYGWVIWGVCTDGKVSCR